MTPSFHPSDSDLVQYFVGHRFGVRWVSDKRLSKSIDTKIKCGFLVLIRPTSCTCERSKDPVPLRVL